MENEILSQQDTESNSAENSGLLKKILNKIKTRKFLIIVIIVGAVVTVLFFFKGIFIAASVDGSFISRLSIIKELERQSGQRAVDSLITNKLIENEVKTKGISVSEDEVDQEIQKITVQVSSQGGTLAATLAMQGMTEEILRKQILIQKQVEKLLADKIAVTDEEVVEYIKDNKVPLPKGKDERTVLDEQIKNQLKNEKLNQEANLLIAGLKSKAKIKYYVDY
ncbi:MAG: SurA N-terminal domain-containing protein [Candidatus Taylorbacteria bacterium]|nr:SurA N-terminal domain-containing protein [Candidatus Taylorbacteria bacterium]